jgi:DNA-binding NarL/FixJ family response regulator
VRPRVLIVDDHPAFRAAARVLLESEGFDVVGEAEDGDTAMAAVRHLEPDVVLLDIQLPGLDGFELSARLGALMHPPAVVLVSSREEAAYGDRVPAAGTRGFLTKRDLSGANLAALLA